MLLSNIETELVDRLLDRRARALVANDLRLLVTFLRMLASLAPEYRQHVAGL